jgi:hypothetical protein
MSLCAILVEESRILQVTIFHTLKKNLDTIDFSVLLLGVMTIADEVDSQLSQVNDKLHRRIRSRCPA